MRTLAGGGGATALLAFLSLGLVPGAVNALMPGHSKRLLATYVAGSSGGMRSALLTAFVPVCRLILGAPSSWPRSPVQSSTSMLRAGQRPPADGIMDMGDTDQMMAEVEIRQDRINTVVVGQPVQVHGAVSDGLAEHAAAHALGLVGLTDRKTYLPANLSGWQKQRVAVARALVSDPALVLADEPTAALDKDCAAEVVDLLKRMGEARGTTTLLVTHDNHILDRADRILTLEEGRIVKIEERG